MSSPNTQPRGRLAPSPTGAQHLGNARTFLVAWLYLRSQNGHITLRIEDLDTPRTKSWASQQAIEDLTWLGLDWDEVAPLQSNRNHRYDELLQKLQASEMVYPCTCSRTQIEASASAPHESYQPSQLVSDATIYPGTCSKRQASDAVALQATGVKFAWRFRMPTSPIPWTDTLNGPQKLPPNVQLGDFVVARNYGPTAYQLAVVADDHDQRINQITRGNDLILSTYRQLAIYQALQWQPPPNWLHVPLVVGHDGKRLAKRHGDTRISHWRAKNTPPEFLLGHLAHSLNLIDTPQHISSKDLLSISQSSTNWFNQIPPKPWTPPPELHP